MDLYDFTGWGFFVTVVSIVVVGSYIRQLLTGLANGIDQRLDEMERKIKEMEEDINRIDRKIPKPFNRWGDLSSE
jgi:hypothetical protein